MEYARNVLGIEDAQHEEDHPDATTLVINQLTCSLVGQTGTLCIQPDTLALQVYGKPEIVVPYSCNYGLNPAFRDAMEQGGLIISGLDAEGEVRMVELAEHQFFMATLFLPQFTSGPEKPEPLIASYLESVKQFRS